MGVLALLAAGAGAVIVRSDDQAVDDSEVAPTESTVRVASEPPVLSPTSSAADTADSAAPTTAPATVAPTVAATTTPPTTVPATVAPTVAPTLAPGTTPPPSLAEVADATGTFVVGLPIGFETNVKPVTLNGVDLGNVSGATNIHRYLAGDFSVLGATVLAGPTAQVGAPSAVLAQFDPGDACTLSDFETDVTTSKGQAVVLSYDDCGGGLYSMVLLALEIADTQQTVFVSVQNIEPASGGARGLAISIVESFRPA